MNERHLKAVYLLSKVRLVSSPRLSPAMRVRIPSTNLVLISWCDRMCFLVCERERERVKHTTKQIGVKEGRQPEESETHIPNGGKSGSLQDIRSIKVQENGANHYEIPSMILP